MPAGSSFRWEIVFDDGTVWTPEYLRDRLLAEAATDGDDTLYGYRLAATLEGGLGNDTLYGQDGSDTYVFTRGDGQDVIDDNGGGDTDRLVIHGYTPDEVTVSQVNPGTSYPDLMLTFAGTTDQITAIQAITNASSDTIEEIVFDDSTVWTPADLRMRAVADAATDGDDVIHGSNYNETLEGGLGNDTLHGWGGSDTFVFRDGDGHDVVADFQAGAGSDDVLDLSGVSAVSDLADIQALAVENSGDLLLDFGNGDAVELAGVTLSEIHADDFRFV